MRLNVNPPFDTKMIVAKNISTRLPILLSILTLVISSAGFSWLNWGNYKFYEQGKKIREVLLHREQTLHKLMYYDEVLSMSAIMSVQTGDPVWETRYKNFSQLYDANLGGIISATSSSSPALIALMQASEKLLTLEGQAFRLQRDGQKGKSFGILRSGEYTRQKSIYSSAVRTLIRDSQRPVNEKIKDLEADNKFFLILSAGILLLSICIWLVIIEMLRRWRKTVIEATREDKYLIRKLQETERNFQRSSDQLEMVLIQLSDDLQSGRYRRF